MNIIFKTLIDKNLEIFLQPIFNTKTNEYQIYEVLSRAIIDGKRYSPPIFLKDQGEAHLAYLTIAVLKKVEQIIPLFPPSINFSVNINLSDFKHSEVLERIKRLHKNIIVEILEHDFNFKNKIAILQELKEKNIKIALDDLGSSFSLANFFIDTLGNYNIFDIVKLDGELTSTLCNKKNFKFIKNLVDIIQNNNQTVVAEHISSEKIYTLATELGADYLQGFFLSEPQPIKDILKNFSANKQNIIVNQKLITPFNVGGKRLAQ